MGNLVSMVDEDLPGIDRINHGFCIIASLLEMDMVISLGKRITKLWGTMTMVSLQEIVLSYTS